MTTTEHDDHEDHDADKVRAHLAAISDALLWAQAASIDTPEHDAQLLAVASSPDYPVRYLILALAHLVNTAYATDPSRVTFDAFLNSGHAGLDKTVQRLAPMWQPFNPDGELDDLTDGGGSDS